MTPAQPDADLIAVDRATGEMRRGRPVQVDTPSGPIVAAAVETLDDTALAALRGHGQPYLLLPLARAMVLKVRTAGTDPVAIAVHPDSDATALMALADATTDLSHPLKGPLTAERTVPLPGSAAAIALAKRARLLPAMVAVAGADDALVAIDEAAIAGAASASATTLRQVATARVPLAGAEDTRIVAFRPADGSLEHLAIIVGDPFAGGSAPLVRLHSECFTGDLLASLKCDCGEQLRGALARMAAAGSGVLLYLAQEGRGIGLINKLRAYRLQDLGFDTVDANTRLGFGADERLFEPAAEMLRRLGLTRVRLLTNNPDKVAGLEACGITVEERIAHTFPANPHNADYLATKKKRSGHYL